MSYNNKKVPYKYYTGLMVVTICLVIINAVGLWMTWFDPENVFGYVSGCFSLVAFVVCAVLAFMNERVLARKQGALWVFYFVGHLTFFLVIWLMSKGEDKSVPCLFTVLLAAIVASTLYIIIKDIINKNRKVGYSFTVSRESLSDHPDEIEIENVMSGKVDLKDSSLEDDHSEDKTSIITL